MRHTLHMHRMREQVHRLDGSQFVAKRFEFFYIRCKCVRVAGDIDNARRFGPADFAHHFAAGAGTRGIEKQQFRVAEAFQHFINPFACVFGKEICV